MKAGAAIDCATRAVQLRTGDWSTLGHDASRVRTEVFVGEQGIAPEDEWDAADAECLHCVAYEGTRAIGTGRLLPDAHIGRMAVLAPYRRAGVGSIILRTLVSAARERGESEVVLSAQTYVAAFYARHGFEPRGEPYDEVGIPHQQMFLRLDSRLPSGSASGQSGRVVVADHSELFQRDWRPATASSANGVYLLHGLGEHVGRYDELARWFTARGWRVRGHDHIGHGQSPGPRGVIARPGQMFEHACELIRRFGDELGRPPLVLSQSMGAALAAAIVHEGGAPVSALLLSAPALMTRANAAQRALAAIMCRVAPRLALANRIDASELSRDATRVRAYQDDPLVHDRISALLYRDIFGWAGTALLRAAQLNVPTLLLIPAADRIVDPEGARRYARLAPTSLLRVHEYPDMRHEPFHELARAREEVLEDLQRWLASLQTAPPPEGNGSPQAGIG